jgi:hypothetical protein
VCPGHGWAFDGDGNAYKRSEFGRADPKGAVDGLDVHDDAGTVRAHAR